jgi:hypothetical protein
MTCDCLYLQRISTRVLRLDFNPGIIKPMVPLGDQKGTR